MKIEPGEIFRNLNNIMLNRIEELLESGKTNRLQIKSINVCIIFLFI